MREIEKKGIKEWLAELDKVPEGGKNSDLWCYVYKLASQPRRKRVAVNLSKLDKVARDGENIVVPGKVLGGGSISKGINVTAVEYSDGVEEKIRGAKGKLLTLQEMMKKEGIRVIG